MYFSVQLMIDLPLGYRQQPSPVHVQGDLGDADAVGVDPEGEQSLKAVSRR